MLRCVDSILVRNRMSWRSLLPASHLGSGNCRSPLYLLAGFLSFEFVHVVCGRVGTFSSIAGHRVEKEPIPRYLAPVPRAGVDSQGC